MSRENLTNRTPQRRTSRRNMACSTEISWPVPMRAIGAQNLLTMPGGVSQSGYLHKKGGSQFSLLKWPLRFIIIHKGCVYYFKSSTSASPQGAFSLMGYNRVMRAAEETTSSNVFPFKIVHFSKKHRTWYFSAACEEERKNWMLHLRQEIDRYHDRKESQTQSDSDSDADSFYGSIERPLDINYSADTPEEDYVIEDDDDEEEDYLKPDGSQNSPDQPTVRPPSYPPPPVPVLLCKAQLRPLNSPLLSKGPPPSVPPAPTKTLPEPIPKKPPPPMPPNKGPPPALPFPPHMGQPHPVPAPKSPKPPLPPPASLKKPHPPASTMPVRGSSPAVSVPPAPCTLPSYKKGAPPLPPSLRTKPQLDLPAAPPTAPPAALLTAPPSRPPMHRPSLGTKPTPLPPAKPKPKTLPLQRSSPDGQSFRTSVDEMPVGSKNSCKDDDDSSDDYENVQLPDSVFVDTTDTSDVERLFKETAKSPQDGLYCIRNSGTKTSKVLVVWDVSLKKARNYRLFEENSRIYLEAEITFPSLAALVEHYYSHALPNHGSLCLQKPYGYTAPR